MPQPIRLTSYWSFIHSQLLPILVVFFQWIYRFRALHSLKQTRSVGAIEPLFNSSKSYAEVSSAK